MDKLKRKKEKEEKVRLEEAFEEFRETFEDGVVKVSKTFIRGDIVNANKSVVASPAIYKPSPIQLNKPTTASSGITTTPATAKQPSGANLELAKKLAEQTAKKIMLEAGTTKQQKPPPSSSSATVAAVAPPTTVVPQTQSQKQKSAPPPPAVDRQPKPSTKKVVEKPRLSNLEAFKEELKQMQAMRDERKGLRQHLKDKMGVPEEELDRIAPSLDSPYPGVTAGPGAVGGGPLDFENDPSTTNLYVCNLPPDAKLEDFFDTFGTFGPLASAKILFPKPDEERFRNTLSGFVAFMNRIDAERALCAMHGDVMRGCELRVSWARPVAIPPLPFYVPLPLRELAMPDPPSGLPFNAKPYSEDLRSFLNKYHDLPKLNAAPHHQAQSAAALSAIPLMSEEMQRKYKKMIENATVRVVTPTERPLLHLIHRVIEFVVRCGPMFEAILMTRERQNPMYRFLFDNHHPTHVYYRWRLYTVLQGDDRQKWRMDKFRMFHGGSWWQPPPHSLFEQGMPPQLYDTAYVPKRRRDKPYEKRMVPVQPRRSRRLSNESADGTDKQRKKDGDRDRDDKKLKGILSDVDRQELEDLLRNLAPEKVAIGDAMVWCLDHAECSKEITQCIFESLCIKETPLYKKVARTYLISDILANCAVRVKDAFYYRQHFGVHLQKIFVELNETLEAIESRLKAEQFRQRVMLCFRNWEDNAVYPTQELIQWQNIFLGLLKNTTGADTDSSVDGEPMPPDEEDEDIDGVPIPEGEDEEDIDGVPMPEEEEDIDGVPMDDEGDEQVPPTVEAQGKEEAERDERFTTGSWNTIEPDEQTQADEPFGLAAATAATAKSKWESIEISRWDRHEGVAAAFAQQQDDEEDGSAGGRSPMRKRHRLSRLSPGAEMRSHHPQQKQNQQHHQQQHQQNETVGGAMDEEERRKILREIEVKVMKMQDEMESEGSIPPQQIDAELSKYRHRLMARMEEKYDRNHNNSSGSSSKSKENSGHGESRKDANREGGSRRERERESHTTEENGAKRRRDHHLHHHNSPPLSTEATHRRRDSIDSSVARDRERAERRRRSRSRDRDRERDRDHRDRDHRGGVGGGDDKDSRRRGRSRSPVDSSGRRRR